MMTDNDYEQAIVDTLWLLEEISGPHLSTLIAVGSLDQFDRRVLNPRRVNCEVLEPLELARTPTAIYQSMQRLVDEGLIEKRDAEPTRSACATTGGSRRPAGGCSA